MFNFWIFVIILIILSLILQGHDRQGLMNKDGQMVAKGAPKPQESAETLRQIKNNMMHLLEYLKVHQAGDARVWVLIKRFNPENIHEKSLSVSGTSYTVDKRYMYLCLREKNSMKHHDVNTLMYVAIHEMAHVMSIDYGHGEEFANNFKWLLEQSVSAGVYKPVNYYTSPQPFCGLIINDNPLFNGQESK